MTTTVPATTGPDSPEPDSTTLLCLHGMACTGRVWDPLVECWPGPMLAPDLAGHGVGPRLEAYGIEAYAEEIRARLASEISAAERLVVVGHSMGGVVGAALLPMIDADFAPDSLALLAVGIKTSWSEEETAGSIRVADKGVRWFDQADEAERWFLKVSGLHGLVETGTEMSASGIVEEDGRFRLRADPETFRAGPPPSLALQLAAIDRPVRLGRGSEDDMVPVEQVAPFDPRFVEFDGAGHSAHVEQPDRLAEEVRKLLPFVH